MRFYKITCIEGINEELETTICEILDVKYMYSLDDVSCEVVTDKACGVVKEVLNTMVVEELNKRESELYNYLARTRMNYA